MSKATTKKAKQKDPEGLPIINLHAAGIDVSASSHMVAVPLDSAQESIREFGAFTPDLHEIARWLHDCHVTTVAMESTGVYWRPLYLVLIEAGFEVYLVNARHVKNVTGKKTDQDDARWIQKLHSCALLNSSFLPDEQTERLRTLVRHRNSLIADSNRYELRIQKALELMNIKVHGVLSNLMGKTGRAMLEAIIGGQRDPEQLIEHVDKRVKADHETIKKSLCGHWREEELLLVEQNYSLYKQLHALAEQCERKIDALLAHWSAQLAQEVCPKEPQPAAKRRTQGKKRANNQPSMSIKERLQRIHGVDVTAIYGISELTALRIFSETGTDLSKWPDEDRFVSWLRLCPNNKISAGKVISSMVMKGKAGYASQAFRQSANALSRSDHWLGDYFRRMRAKAGNKYAIIAVARKLAIIYYKMVRYKQAFKAVDVDEYREKNKAARIKYLEKQLAKIKGAA